MGSSRSGQSGSEECDGPLRIREMTAGLVWVAARPRNPRGPSPAGKQTKQRLCPQESQEREQAVPKPALPEWFRTVPPSVTCLGQSNWASSRIE